MSPLIFKGSPFYTYIAGSIGQMLARIKKLMHFHYHAKKVPKLLTLYTVSYLIANSLLKCGK